MKKLLVLFMAIVGISFAANGQICEIKGAEGVDDGSTVMVTNHFIEGEKVVVLLGNDSEKTCANVTVVVTVNGKKEEYKGYGKSCPGTTRIEVQIGEPIKSYEVKTVSGNKCSNT